VIEVEVHQQLRAILREQGQPLWPHHLTVARLVARGLRLGRSALMQMDPLSHSRGRHRLSYWVSLLIWPGPVIVVAPSAVTQTWLHHDIPQLRNWTQSIKPIQVGDRWPGEDFYGVCITTPESWLRDRIHREGRFPPGIPTVFDSADELETLAVQQLTLTLEPADWQSLMLACPCQTDAIRDAQAQITQAIYQHPQNPYEAGLGDPTELAPLRQLLTDLANADYPAPLPPRWQRFAEAISQPHTFSPQPFLWYSVLRRQGQFQLHCTPAQPCKALEPIWAQQPLLLLGSALDLDPDAGIYRQRLGLGDMTCIGFGGDRHDEALHLYQPSSLPMPNTPDFQPALLRELRKLLMHQEITDQTSRPTVLLVGDMPLKTRIGSILAAEFGSRVQVERTCLEDNGILVTGWEFWQTHQMVLPAPAVLAIATLPLPTLEHPLVAGRVAAYKQMRQDWFRLYLLPMALTTLQRSIAPVRASQGLLALFDTRVIHRSYGQQILTALQPVAQFSHWERGIFSELPPWD
jgi:ATP-dependent DNA helicase DinG